MKNRTAMDTQRHLNVLVSRYRCPTKRMVLLDILSKTSGRWVMALRILAGKQRRSLSTWQTTHRDLSYEVSI